ncbi:MAG: phosphohistidine phosphatase SixA [Chloroflexi bacterium]|nr:phosphohistidine phosphatase SixA [Chloroflexota bacterium]OJV86826.1 MAG: phosphohistidine phosphatase SixA [Chloroflexi bacterium 54-19]
MLIILARHADRETLTTRPDSEQVLTEKGIQQAVQLGQALDRRLAVQGGRVSLVLTSPYQRAVQTAQLMAQEMGLPAESVQTLQALAPDGEGSVHETLQAVTETEHHGVIVVGHGPDLAALADRLCGQAVELKKAHSLGIERDAERHIGRLVWLVSYKDYL